jgi:hypothetical protein
MNSEQIVATMDALDVIEEALEYRIKSPTLTDSQLAVLQNVLRGVTEEMRRIRVRWYGEES